MEEIVKNSISMIEFKKTQFLLEESKNSLNSDLENTKKELENKDVLLKEEKKLNYILIGIAFVLFIALVIIWLILLSSTNKTILLFPSLILTLGAITTSLFCPFSNNSSKENVLPLQLTLVKWMVLNINTKIFITNNSPFLTNKMQLSLIQIMLVFFALQ